jgi:hypothetical protein
VYDMYTGLCTLGHQSLVMILTRYGLSLPIYFLADEQHSRCLTDKVYLPTMVHGRILWHLSYVEKASRERVRCWFQDKKAGWYAVLADPQMLVPSTLLDQAHVERTRFAMKGFQHPAGSQQVFLTGLTPLYRSSGFLMVAEGKRESEMDS